MSTDATSNSKQRAVGMVATPHPGGRELLISMQGGGMEVHQLGPALSEVQSDEAESMRYWLETV